MSQQEHPLSPFTESHVHYHYHYYYPTQVRGPSSKELKKKLSKSFIYQVQRQDSFKSPGADHIARMDTQGEESSEAQKRERWKMSQVWQERKSDFMRNYGSEQLSNIKSKSVVEEQLQQYEQQIEHQPNIQQTDRKSIKTGIQSNIHHQQLIAYYEAELRKYKSQTQRLKMVEEQCIYLRDKFYNHYVQQCNNNI